MADPLASPGVWLTDIVSGRCRYAALAPEQLEGMARWTVLLGVEALLRELEHDADLLARRGQPVADIASLRRELRMPADAWR